MITLKAQTDPDKFHNVICRKPIGEFFEGQKALVQMMKMHGRIYKPGKNAQGKFIDIEGKPDERLMVFDSKHYCCATKEELDNHFDEIL
jgi:hypothetical protein